MTNADLNKLSLNELSDLNNRVIKMIKLKRNLEGAMKMDELGIGMTVKYTGGTSRIKDETFTIEKINRVNVVCKSNATGQRWRINPANLEQA